MAGQTTGTQKAYKIMDADGAALYTGVTYGTADGECIKPTANNAVPLGIISNDERLSTSLGAGGDQTGREITVQLNSIANIKLGANVTYGARVIMGTGGTAIPVPIVAGTYNVLGFAEKAGVTGDIVPVRMAFHMIIVE